MAVPVERIKKYRRWFGWGFIVFLIPSVTVTLRLMSDPYLPVGEEGFGVVTNTPTLLGIASLVTSCTTLIGFIVTTIITWRKERRESDHASIELEKKQLELEKLRREIGDRNSAAQKKKKMTRRRWVG